MFVFQKTAKFSEKCSFAAHKHETRKWKSLGKKEKEEGRKGKERK